MVYFQHLIISSGINRIFSYWLRVCGIKLINELEEKGDHTYSESIAKQEVAIVSKVLIILALIDTKVKIFYTSKCGELFVD